MGQRPFFADALANNGVIKPGPDKKRVVPTSGATSTKEGGQVNPTKKPKVGSSSSSQKSKELATTKVPVSQTANPVTNFSVLPPSASPPPPPLPTPKFPRGIVWSYKAPVAQTANPIPSFSALPPSTSLPPPPPPTPKFPRGVVWSHKVPTELSYAICPPERFSEPTKYGNAELQKITDLERYALQFTGLAQTLITMNTGYASQAAKLQRMKSEAEEQKLLMEAVKSDALEQVKVAEAARDKMKQEIETVKADINKVISNLHQFQEAHAKDKSTIGLLEHEQKELRTQLGACQDALDATSAAIKEKDAAILKSVEESFENALMQIRLLNPDVNFNTSGMDYMSFINGDRIVPLFPSPDTVSQSQFKGNQGEDEREEVQTRAKSPSC